MTGLHRPIPDVSGPGPELEATWQGEVRRVQDGGAGSGGAGEAPRARLRDAFSVLVHVKGGLGQAGTIAARLQVELGVEPCEAVARMRAVRPGALGTAAEEAHVLGSRAVPEPEPLTSAAAIRDRAVGCLLAWAVGDAVGTTLEFTARDIHPSLTDMVGRRTLPPRSG